MQEADVAMIETLPIRGVVSSTADSDATSDPDSFFRINCHRNHKLWIAWFESTPDILGGGDDPSEAIANLLVMFDDGMTP